MPKFSFAHIRRRSRRIRTGYPATFEQFEARSLLAVAVEPVPLTGSTGANISVGDLAATADGHLWIKSYYPTPGFGRMSLSGGDLSAIMPRSGPGTVTWKNTDVVGPDGNLWFTDEGSVNRFSASGVQTRFDVSPSRLSQPGSITVGPDGALWFAEDTGIGRITTDGQLTEFPLPDSEMQPADITTGPDGALWFTVGRDNTGDIGRISTAGEITLFPLPEEDGRPYAIAAGADGNLWFAEGGAARIGQISPSGVFREFPLPDDPWHPISNGWHWTLPVATDLVTDSDGNLWYVEAGRGVVGRLTSTGDVSEWLLPGGGNFEKNADYVIPAYRGAQYAAPLEIVAGSDGNLYIAGEYDPSLWRVNLSAPAATMSAYAVAATTVEGTGFDGTIAHFTYGDPTAQDSDFSISIAWSDNFNGHTLFHYPTGEAVSDGHGGFDVVIHDIFSRAGHAGYTVTITDRRVAVPTEATSIALSYYVDVTDAPIIATPLSPTVTFAGVMTNDIDLGSFRDTGVSTGFGSEWSRVYYQGQIDWGDGSPVSQPYPRHGYYGVERWDGYGELLGSHQFPGPGIYHVRVTIGEAYYPTNDPASLSKATFDTTMTVVSPATDISASPITIVQGESGEWELASFQYPDPTATADQFSAYIYSPNGLNTPPKIRSVGDGLFLVTATGHFSSAGTIPMSLAIKDRNGQTISLSGTIQVADLPLEASGRTLQAAVSNSFDPVVATFTDPDPGAATYKYRASIDWGDGTSPTSGTIGAGPAGSFTASGTHIYDRIGTYEVRVTIADVDQYNRDTPPPPPSEVVALTTVTVTAPLAQLSASDISAQEADQEEWQVATFATNDPTDTDFSARITWGDLPNLVAHDGLPGQPGTIRSLGDGRFAVSAIRPVDSVGSFRFDVEITPRSGQREITSGTLNVAEAPVVLKAMLPEAFTSPFVGLSTPSWLFQISDPGLFDTKRDFDVLIDWGDGTTSDGTLKDPIVGSRSEGSIFPVLGGHAYAKAGVYTVNASVSDRYGTPISRASTRVLVRPSPIDIVPAGATLMGTEGTSLPISTPLAYFVQRFATSAADFGITVDWGDGSTSAGTAAPIGSPGEFVVTGGHTYLDPGPYAVKVTVRDPAGQGVSTTAAAYISSLPTPLAGALDPSSDSGTSSSDGITNIRTPTFRGVTSPGYAIILRATPIGSSQAVQVGQALADANSHWSITTIPFSDGSYTVTAFAYNPSGRLRNMANLTPTSPLMIDTSGPVVSVASFDARTGRLSLALSESATSPDPVSITIAPTKGAASRQVLHPTALVAGPGSLLTTFNRGKRLTALSYKLSFSAGAFRDLAGNASTTLSFTLGQSAIPRVVGGKGKQARRGS